MSDRPAPLWKTEQLAAYLGVSVGTIHNWRSRGEGPPALKANGTLRFRQADVDAWLSEQGRRGVAA